VIDEWTAPALLTDILGVSQNPRSQQRSYEFADPRHLWAQ
jgi:hypothetical protein